MIVDVFLIDGRKFLVNSPFGSESKDRACAILRVFKDRFNLVCKDKIFSFYKGSLNSTKLTIHDLKKEKRHDDISRI